MLRVFIAFGVARAMQQSQSLITMTIDPCQIGILWLSGLHLLGMVLLSRGGDIGFMPFFVDAFRLF
jgi:hypothetical protein